MNILNKKDPPTALTVLAVNVPLLLLYRKDDLLNIFLPERYICAKGQDTQVSAAAVLIKDKPISQYLYPRATFVQRDKTRRCPPPPC